MRSLTAIWHLRSPEQLALSGRAEPVFQSIGFGICEIVLDAIQFHVNATSINVFSFPGSKSSYIMSDTVAITDAVCTISSSCLRKVWVLSKWGKEKSQKDFSRRKGIVGRTNARRRTNSRQGR